MPQPLPVVLVHGAFADHHAFDAVVPLLLARGLAPIAPDLPGHGDDPTGPQGLTLESYIDAIARVVEAQSQPVVLVGHSMAGMVVSGVAERLTPQLRRLVYVAAYLPRDGQSLQQLAETDTASLVGQNMVFAPDWSTVTIRTESVAEAIAADLPPEIQALIVASQRPEPLAPFQGAVSLTPERFGRVPRAYLSTTRDRAVTPDLQQSMLAAYPDTVVARMETSHLPFLARPEEFVTRLVELIDVR